MCRLTNFHKALVPKPTTSPLESSAIPAYLTYLILHWISLPSYHFLPRRTLASSASLPLPCPTFSYHLCVVLCQTTSLPRNTLGQTCEALSETSAKPLLVPGQLWSEAASVLVVLFKEHNAVHEYSGFQCTYTESCPVTSAGLPLVLVSCSDPALMLRSFPVLLGTHLLARAF